MEKINTNIDGLFIIEPKIFKDSRGYFYESFSEKKFNELGLFNNFVQDNQSFSHKNVLRGLHFQHPPYGQIKLVSVLRGAILDVVVDIRLNSKTYGKYFSILLNENNKKMLYIPEGFAHGFLSLIDNTIIQYKCSELYNKESEGCLKWDDKTVNINWGEIDKIIISDKDKEGLKLEEILYE